MRASWVESFKISVSGVRVAARRREATSAKKRLALVPEATKEHVEHQSILFLPFGMVF